VAIDWLYAAGEIVSDNDFGRNPALAKETLSFLPVLGANIADNQEERNVRFIVQMIPHGLYLATSGRKVICIRSRGDRNVLI
jgi:hypothetical protein